MNNIIGIRHEDKYLMERRVAIIPAHVCNLVDQGLKFQVQTSPKRVFSDQAFSECGAKIVEKLDQADVIFGVKEMPNDLFMPHKTYIFFSHVIKGQEYNMPMLKKMIEQKVNLIDYEKIADDEGRRLIFFGRFAGLAGMINSLWALGLRLEHYGYDTPFKNLKQTHRYSSLKEAKNDIREAGHWISENGLPEELLPFTIGFTGYGNVSNGAQEIADLLPGMYVTPEELTKLESRDNLPDNIIYKTVFREEHIVTPNAGQAFDLHDYYDHPEKYDSQFERYLPHLSVLMNCMYWDERYPRIVTKDYLKKVFSEGTPKLTVIGDVTCDPDGSIECTFKGTEIEDPIFVYNPLDDSYTMGHKGEGILDMAVDILPSELPLESSIAFSNALVRYLPAIASEDLSRSFEQISLPGPVKRAMILHQGKLTPDYQYLEEHLK